MVDGARAPGRPDIERAIGVALTTWMHAGRISCPRHGDWLFFARDNLGRAHCDPEHRARHGVSVRAVHDMLDHHANLERSTAHWWIADAGERLKAFEAAIIAATAGYSPPDEQWGSLRARDFLNIVQDVTSWSVTNFENFKAPCPATVYYQTWAPFLPPIFLFAPSHVPAWLVSRMQQWPEGYKNSCWVACEELLVTLPTGACEAIK